MLIAQITDLHVSPSLKLPGGDPAAPTVMNLEVTLQTAVRQLNAMSPRPDVVVATGDITADGTQQQYEITRQHFADLDMPVFAIPGNHDDRDRMRECFKNQPWPASERLNYAVDDFAVRLVFLDTLVPGELGGDVGPAQLEWLDQTLGVRPVPTIVFMHHPPFATGIAMFDRMGCSDGDALGAVIQKHGHVLAVGCGHVHRPIHLGWYGTVVHVAPSIGYQYALALDEAVPVDPTKEPPACLMYHYDETRGLIVHQNTIQDLPKRPVV